MDKPAAAAWLSSLLNKELRIVVTDGRMFIGTFRCTDSDSNIILGMAREYRFPSAERSLQPLVLPTDAGLVGGMDRSSRFLGSIVVPGQHIRSITLEEFASQVKPSDQTRFLSSLRARGAAGEEDLVVEVEERAAMV